MKIALDGPAAVGKTTVGEQISNRFSLLFIKSGEIYRALAYLKINRQDFLDLSLEIKDRELTLRFEGEVLSNKLSTEKIGEEASKLAKEPEARKFVKIRIREIAEEYDVLVEGRDIGTEVLPEANPKIFLTASVKERAKRRKKQLSSHASIEQVEKQIRNRDRRDKQRDIDPLKPAEDATIIDTTLLSKKEVINRIAKLIDR